MHALSFPVTCSVALCCFGLLVWKREAVSFLEWDVPVVSHDGRRIGGAPWQWSDGQMAEKFLMGREKSQLWQAYGSVYRIWSGTTSEIVLTESKDVQKFHADSQNHLKARSSNAGFIFHQFLGDCLGLINGERWKALRAQMESSFSRHSAYVASSATLSSAHDYVQQLDFKSEMGIASSSFRVGAVEAFQAFPFFHTAKILYGEMDEGQRNKLWAIGLQRLPLLRWLDPQAMRELSSFQKKWQEFNQEMFNKSLSGSSQPLILPLWQLTLDGVLPESEVLQTFDEMLFANLDVTTHVLTWMITLLADDKTAQAKLREEIMDSRGDLASYVDRKDTYLNCCFLESLRVRPVAAFTIPEYSPVAKELGGYTIPAKMNVVVDTIAINIRSPFWEPDSTQFKPERFYRLKSTELRYNLFTFGFGTRKCLGQYEAEASIKALVVQLISQYHLSVASGKGVSDQEFVVKQNWIPLAAVELTFERIGLKAPSALS